MLGLIDAAKALSIDREVGPLEAGKLAGIILVDRFRPHVMPMNMPAYRVTCFANAADACMTMVGGRGDLATLRVRVLSASGNATMPMVGRPRTC